MADTIFIANIDFSCWESPKDQPPFQFNEIIAITLAKCDLNSLAVTEPSTILIKPGKSKISKFCTKVTGLNQEDVDNGISFKEASEFMVQKLKSKEVPWYSWGDFDRKFLLKQCGAEHIDYPFGGGHTNFQSLFTSMLGLKKMPRLKKAFVLTKLELEENNKPANKVNNLAKLVQYTYGKIRKEIIN